MALGNEALLKMTDGNEAHLINATTFLS